MKKKVFCFTYYKYKLLYKLFIPPRFAIWSKERFDIYITNTYINKLPIWLELYYINIIVYDIKFLTYSCCLKLYSEVGGEVSV